MCKQRSEKECNQRECEEERRDEMEEVSEKLEREVEEKRGPIELLGDTISYLTGRRRVKKGPRLEERKEGEKGEGENGDEEKEGCGQ